MQKLSLALAISLGFAAPAFAEAAAQSDTFVHEGVEYTYTTEDLGDKVLVKGTSDDGAKYTLIVSDKRVHGTMNGRPVSFSRSQVKPFGTVEMAQR